MRYYAEVAIAAVAMIVCVELVQVVAKDWVLSLFDPESPTSDVVSWFGRIIPISLFVAFVYFRRQNRERSGK